MKHILRPLAGFVMVTAVLLVSAPGESQAQETTQAASLEKFLSRFKDVGGLSATFEETQHIALLTAPLVHRGTIHFDPPARLVKVNDGPRPATLLIHGDNLTMSDGKNTKVLDLNTIPVASHIVTSLVDVLDGRSDRIKGSFDTHFKQGSKMWWLTLEPKAAPLNKVLRRLKFTGTGQHVTKVEIFEANGDRRELSLSNVQPRKYTEAERQQIFRVNSK